MSDKPAHIFIAKTASFPGYWGSSKEGTHHAIASCCDVGADRGSVFVVYDAYEGCRMSEMGGMVYLEEHGEPTIEGVYDAAGNYLGSDLCEASKDFSEGYKTIEDCALSAESIRSLKAHKPE
jgi:hypothetical protein